MRVFENFSFSKFVLFQIFLIWVFLFFYNENNKKDHIRDDVLEYYSYLPAAFLCGDITLTQPVSADCKGRFWLVTTKDGKKLIKMTMGMALLYSPFFIVAHYIAPILHDSQDAYSATYQTLMAFSSIFYLMLGLYYLRKLMLNFYSDRISAAVIACLFFGTNLFCYSTCNGEFLMPHTYLFSLTCLVMYFTKKLHDEPSARGLFLLGFLVGLITLIRPTNGIIVLVPLLYGINDMIALKQRIFLSRAKIRKISIFTVAFLVPIIPQLIYWKATTGRFIFYSYLDNSFFFLHPHILEGLFGFRKGLFIYTPILFFAILAFLKFRKVTKGFFLPIVVILPIFTYVTLSWWCWWYGGSFGNRPFIDIYPLFALPFAGTLRYITTKNNFIKGSILVVFEFLIVLNLFQTWQYKRGILHYGAMTREAYFEILGNQNWPGNYLQLINEPDAGRVSKGLSEKMNLEDLHSLKLYIKSIDCKYLNCDSAKGLGIQANSFDKSTFSNPETELFLIKESGNVKQYSIKAFNGKYLKVYENGEIHANSDSLCRECVFRINILEKDGWISIRALNNKYLLIDKNDNVLKLGTEKFEEAAMFKVFTVW